MPVVTTSYARARADVERKRPPGMLSTAEACKAIGVGPATIAYHVRTGTLTPHKTVDGTGFWDLDRLITEWACSVKTTTGLTPQVIRDRKAELQAKAPASPPTDDGDDDKDLTPERYERERTRKLIAERKICERNDRKQAGELVEAEAITRAWNAAAIELRDGIMVIGARLCHELAVLSDAREIKARIEAACRQALTATAKRIASIDLAPTRAAEPEPAKAPTPKTKAPKGRKAKT